MNPYLKILYKYSYHSVELGGSSNSKPELIARADSNKKENERIQGKAQKLEVKRFKNQNLWDLFFENLRSRKEFGRVVSRPQVRFGYKVEVSLKNGLGIGFCATYMGKISGIYYTSHNPDSLNPIREFTTDFDKSIRFNKHLSYHPFSQEQFEIAKELDLNFTRFFPDFVPFNNFFADHELWNIVIGEDFIPRTDLFRAFFSDSMIII